MLTHGAGQLGLGFSMTPPERLSPTPEPIIDYTAALVKAMARWRSPFSHHILGKVANLENEL